MCLCLENRQPSPRFLQLGPCMPRHRSRPYVPVEGCKPLGTCDVSRASIISLMLACKPWQTDPFMTPRSAETEAQRGNWLYRPPKAQCDAKDELGSRGEPWAPAKRGHSVKSALACPSLAAPNPRSGFHDVPVMHNYSAYQTVSPVSRMRQHPATGPGPSKLHIACCLLSPASSRLPPPGVDQMAMLSRLSRQT